MALGWRLLLRMAIAGLTLTMLALAAHADDISDCNSSDMQRRIDACSAIIDRGTEAANVAMAYNNLGVTYNAKGEYDRAIKDYNRAIALDPKFLKAHINRGNAYLNKHEHDRAIEDYDRAIALNLKYAPAYMSRGNAYNDKGEHDRAIEDYDRAIALDPKFALAFMNRGNAYSKKGDTDRAITDYDRAITLDPKDAKAYYNRGNANVNKGDTKRAIEDYDRAISLNPKRPNYYNSRCWARAVAGTNLDVARADCNAALARADNEPNTLDSRGLVGIKQGFFDMAWADYDAAHQAKPENAGFLYGRGIAAIGLGRKAEGMSDLAAAMKLDRKIAETFSGYGVPAP